ncbi:amidase [Nocardioides sp.]|uniref:amidase n=1 Tax=Nocardioides sp. TaxID=35761 RepID=UPI00260C31F9|nr:amidase [Nocardioides sp.]MCW2736815.1 Amidase [Nocardioides sp.]
MEPYELTSEAAGALIRSGELSPVELIDSVLARIQATEPRVMAFSHLTAEQARDAAIAAEQELASGRYRGPLHGLPLAVKDLYDTAGVPTTASSAVREGNVPSSDAAVVRRLLDAGMIMVGKTFTHEFAYGSFTPPTRNPWDGDHIPGGSSGGSAAAVAAGSCVVALGTDTAGSIRMPASFCGVVGLKPTYGRASKRGVTPLAWSLDHVGPMARNTRDVALVMDAIAGHDPLDSGSVDAPVPDHAAGLASGVDGLRVGVPTNYFFEHVADDVEQAVRAAIVTLQGLGAEVREVVVPHADVLMAAEWGIMLPEASAYHQQSLRDNGDLYGADVRALLEAGELVLATDYIRAQRVRAVIREAWRGMFSDIDVLVTPTVPFAAPRAGEAEVNWGDGTIEAVHDATIRLTSPANVTGVPALTIPVGFSRAGLPLGMQIHGRPFAEATVLRVGYAYEVARGAHAWPTLAD